MDTWNCLWQFQETAYGKLLITAFRFCVIEPFSAFEFHDISGFAEFLVQMIQRPVSLGYSPESSNSLIEKNHFRSENTSTAARGGEKTIKLHESNGVTDEGLSAARREVVNRSLFEMKRFENGVDLEEGKMGKDRDKASHIIKPYFLALRTVFPHAA